VNINWQQTDKNFTEKFSQRETTAKSLGGGVLFVSHCTVYKFNSFETD